MDGASCVRDIANSTLVELSVSSVLTRVVIRFLFDNSRSCCSLVFLFLQQQIRLAYLLATIERKMHETLKKNNNNKKRRLHTQTLTQSNLLTLSEEHPTIATIIIVIITTLFAFICRIFIVFILFFCFVGNRNGFSLLYLK